MADDASGSGASDCIPIQAGALKKGSHVVLKGFPCKIVDYSCVLFALHALHLVIFLCRSVDWVDMLYRPSLFGWAASCRSGGWLTWGWAAHVRLCCCLVWQLPPMRHCWSWRAADDMFWCTGPA